jgi:predicted membrane chloride channel (bestrophin family)
MKKIKRLTSVINFRVFIVTITTLVAFYLCYNYNLKLYVDFNIISIAIIFPLVFTITGAYQKRQDALKLLSDYRANIVGISDYFKTVYKMPKENITKFNSILSSVSKTLYEMLTDKYEKTSIEDIRYIMKEIHGIIYQNMSRLNEREKDSLIGTKKEISRCIENLNALNIHGTPSSLRSYCLFFIYIFPFIYVPALFNHSFAEVTFTNQIIMMILSVLISFILMALYNIQLYIENPFDQEGLDDIKTEIFKIEDKEID